MPQQNDASTQNMCLPYYCTCPGARCLDSCWSGRAQTALGWTALSVGRLSPETAPPSEASSSRARPGKSALSDGAAPLRLQAAASSGKAPLTGPDCACRFLVITDSDATYQRLLEEGFPEEAQAIVVTSKGVPDLATRVFLHALISGLPHLRPMAGC